MPRLEDWSYSAGAYGAPELGGKLMGTVYGHPRFADETFVIISRIVGITKRGLLITVGKNKYKLGKPLREYEEKFPGANERLIKRIREYFKEK